MRCNVAGHERPQHLHKYRPTWTRETLPPHERPGRSCWQLACKNLGERVAQVKLHPRRHCPRKRRAACRAKLLGKCCPPIDLTETNSGSKASELLCRKQAIGPALASCRPLALAKCPGVPGMDSPALSAKPCRRISPSFGWGSKPTIIAVRYRMLVRSNPTVWSLAVRLLFARHNGNSICRERILRPSSRGEPPAIGPGLLYQ